MMFLGELLASISMALPCMSKASDAAFEVVALLAQFFPFLAETVVSEEKTECGRCGNRCDHLADL